MSLSKIVRSTPIIRGFARPLFAARNTVREWWDRKAKQERLRTFGNLRELLVEDPVVKIADLDSQFAIDVRSDVFRRIVTTRHYEPQLFARCRALVPPNRDVIDVGANVGIYTVFLAKQLTGRKVLAVEPTVRAISRLKRNIQMNNVADRVVIFEGVASNQLGHVEIKTVEGREEYSSIGEMSHPAISNAEYSVADVASTTLDHLVDELSLDPGFIKIDAEGSEHLVFSGALRVLKQKRPIVLCELDDFMLRNNGSSFAEVANVLHELDYQIVDPADMKPIGKHHNGHDILCLPRSAG